MAGRSAQVMRRGTAIAHNDAAAGSCSSVDGGTRVHGVCPRPDHAARSVASQALRDNVVHNTDRREGAAVGGRGPHGRRREPGGTRSRRTGEGERNREGRQDRVAWRMGSHLTDCTRTKLANVPCAQSGGRVAAPRVRRDARYLSCASRGSSYAAGPGRPRQLGRDDRRVRTRRRLRAGATSPSTNAPRVRVGPARAPSPQVARSAPPSTARRSSSECSAGHRSWSTTALPEVPCQRGTHREDLFHRWGLG